MKTPEEIDQERKRILAEIEEERLVVAANESPITAHHHPSIPKIGRQRLAMLELELALLDSMK